MFNIFQKQATRQVKHGQDFVNVSIGHVTKWNCHPQMVNIMQKKQFKIKLC
jgi:hypothetical protein